MGVGEPSLITHRRWPDDVVVEHLDAEPRHSPRSAVVVGVKDVVEVPGLVTHATRVVSNIADRRKLSLSLSASFWDVRVAGINNHRHTVEVGEAGRGLDEGRELSLSLGWSNMLRPMSTTTTTSRGLIDARRRCTVFLASSSSLVAAGHTVSSAATQLKDGREQQPERISALRHGDAVDRLLVFQEEVSQPSRHKRARR